MFKVIGATALVIAAGVTSAQADFTICNKSSQKVSAAFGYQHEEDQWASAGWYNLDPGECERVYRGDLGNKFYYVFAEGAKGGIWKAKKGQKGGFFCTQSTKFTLYNRDYEDDEKRIDCEASKLVTRQFILVDTGDHSDFTFNLNN